MPSLLGLFPCLRVPPRPSLGRQCCLRCCSGWRCLPGPAVRAGLEFTAPAVASVLRAGPASPWTRSALAGRRLARVVAVVATITVRSSPAGWASASVRAVERRRDCDLRRSARWRWCRVAPLRESARRCSPRGVSCCRRWPVVYPCSRPPRLDARCRLSWAYPRYSAGGWSRLGCRGPATRHPLAALACCARDPAHRAADPLARPRQGARPLRGHRAFTLLVAVNSSGWLPHALAESGASFARAWWRDRRDRMKTQLRESAWAIC